MPVEIGKHARAALRDHRHVARRIDVAGGEGDHAALRQAEFAPGVGPVEAAARQRVGDRPYRSVEAHPGEVSPAVVVVLDHQPAAVGRPLDRVDASIESAGELAYLGAIDIAHIQASVRKGLADVIEAAPRDHPPVRRDGGIEVRSLPAGDRAHGAAGEVDPVELAFLRFSLPVFVPVRAHHQRAPVGGEVDTSVVIELAEGHLPRRSAGRRNDEYVGEARLEVALAVGAERDPVDDLERRRPLRPFGLGRRGGAKPGPLVGHDHRVGDRSAVGRPGQVGGAVRKAGQPRSFAALHPAHEELRSAALRRRYIGEAGAVGRPPGRHMRARPGNQRLLRPAGDVDQPDGRAHPVGHHVGRPADISDAPPVGADLRIGRDRQAEQILARECPSGCVLCRERRGQAQHQEPEKQMTHEMTPVLTGVSITRETL
jgi:hypothetical protein